MAVAVRPSSHKRQHDTKLAAATVTWANEDLALTFEEIGVVVAADERTVRRWRSSEVAPGRGTRRAWPRSWTCATCSARCSGTPTTRASGSGRRSARSAGTRHSRASARAGRRRWSTCWRPWSPAFSSDRQLGDGIPSHAGDARVVTRA